MKFRLHFRLGQTAIREIGNHLRAYGSGHHWIEKNRGEIFIHAGDERDERILLSEFSDMLEVAETCDTNTPRS
jgi:hypothetical protein